jgi:DNA-binding NarL/FixJ family response regulator
MSVAQKTIRVVLVEDEYFSRSIVSEMLTASGLNILSVGSVADALDSLETFDPHVIVTDLDLGPGPDGGDLLAKVMEERPWTGMVVLTAHASPELAIKDPSRIPENAGYVVKSELHSIHKLILAIEESIVMPGNFDGTSNSSEDKIIITSSQAEILRLIADGLSNASIAEARGISIRSTEALIQRTFVALGLNANPNINPRVTAAKMWQQGKVAVK